MAICFFLQVGPHSPTLARAGFTAILRRFFLALISGGATLVFDHKKPNSTLFSEVSILYARRDLKHKQSKIRNEENNLNFEIEKEIKAVDNF